MRKQKEQNESVVKTWFVYIVQCKDDTLYVGSTSNIQKRIREHNHSKRGAHYTKIRRPVRLVYVEVCETYSEVRKKEAAFKALTRTEKRDLIKRQDIIDTSATIT